MRKMASPVTLSEITPRPLFMDQTKHIVITFQHKYIFILQEYFNMFALTNTISSRSSVVCGQPIRANGTRSHSRRMAARIVCEDAPEKKSAKKAKAASLRYVECQRMRHQCPLW